MPLQDSDGFIRRILSRVSGLVRRHGKQVAGPVAYAEDAAKPVTFDTAMQVSAFWACAKLITETVASLPLVMYRLQGAQRVAVDDHWLYRLLAYRPNRYQDRIQFFETLLLQLCTSGNGYCLVERNGVGQVTSLLPLMSAQVELELLADGSVVYLHYRDDGVAVLAAESVWHLRLFGNGLVGLSPLDYARNSIGLAQAGESRVTSVFRNGAKPTGVLMVDAKLNKEQRAEIRNSFAELAEGNSDSLIVLDKFMKYQQVSMSPSDIELLESRRFQMEDIARFMGVPSILINDAQQSTAWGTGIRSIIEGWFKTGLRPYLERIEVSARVSLLPTAERERYEIEFDFDSLLRMDQKSRMEANQVAINSGQLTPNEARALEGRAPSAGGDQLLVQGAMVPVVQAGTFPAQKASPELALAPALPPINVLVNPPQVTVHTAPVEVRLEPQINVDANKRGEVIREVVETDRFGIPTKVIEREIRRGES